MTHNADQIADGILPLDGPYDPEAMALTGQLLGELVRRLNHATLWHNIDESLPYPDGVDTQVAGLAGATAAMGQLLGQLAYRLGSITNDERLQVDGRGTRLSPLEVTANATQYLTDASASLAQAHAALAKAQNSTSRLAWNDPDDD
jgi:hypothetical protein